MAQAKLVQGGVVKNFGSKKAKFVPTKSTQPVPQVLGAVAPPAARGDDFAPAVNEGAAKAGTTFMDEVNKFGSVTGAVEQRSSGPSPALTALSIANSPTVSSRSGATATGSYQTSAIGGSDRRYSRYGFDDEESPTIQPPSYDEIQKQLAREAQKEVNSLRSYEKSLLDEQKQSNEESLRQNAAVNTLTGLAGSTEADRTTNLVRKEGLQANERIMAAINTQVQSVLSSVRKDARDLYQFERSEARLDETARQAQQAARQEKASGDVAILAQSGATAEGFAQTDPEGYQYLASQVGGEQILKSMFTLNRPQETVLDKRIEGGKYVIAYQNPLDGKVRLETVDLGLPVGYSKTIDAGNRILAVPDNWSGDPSELITINKGLTPQQQIDNSPIGGVVTGNVQRDAESIMAGTLNLTDVSTAKNYRSLVAAELKKQADEAQQSGDTYGLMKASAAYDKEVSDTFLQSMEKTISVMDQLGVLQENIAGTDTGPIVGAFRSANPWDANAQTIKAQLNAIVPNLARGVYGEVGVLTDNDIKTYAKTIPTLTSTEEVRNAVLYITIDMIRRNIDTKIKNQAAGQRDMSGYADIYNQVQNTANTILSTLPNARPQGGSSLADRVAAAGYDYAAMKADGFSDEEIEQAIQ